MSSLEQHFEQVGGISLLAAFNFASLTAPKWERVLDRDLVFADVTQRMRLGVDLCWPERPNQRGYASDCTRLYGSQILTPAFDPGRFVACASGILAKEFALVVEDVAAQQAGPTPGPALSRSTCWTVL